ncbi:hypothetical protein LguiA_023922 [Lonicera macranthoides]
MGDKIIEGEFALGPPSPSVVAVAIDGDIKSKHVVKWALDKFAPKRKVLFKLLHVRPTITNVPTPIGLNIRISLVREDVANAFRKEVEWRTNRNLLPFMKMCAQKKVQAEIVQIESDDVVNAIVGEVARSNINELVIGASSSITFLWGRNLSSRISERAPKFCTVYAVSKGKLSSMRPSDSEANENIKDDQSDKSYSAKSSSSNASVSQTGTNSTETDHLRNQSVYFGEGKEIINYFPGKSDNVTSDQASSLSETPTDLTSERQANIDFELEKLRIELKHIQEMQAIAQSEATNASEKLKDLHKCHFDETMKLKEIKLKEEEAKELAKEEKEKYEAAKTETEQIKERADIEAAKRKMAATKASREAREKEKLAKALVGPAPLYQKFTWEEIEAATSSFSKDLRIGMGSYGTVYKCSLHHTTAAVKVLHSKETNWTKQFLQEIEILSKIRHPHLLILFGACLDRGCLVYEYMENGSLEERLFQKNNTPPIPWFDRFRIAWEVASALVFLHNSKPKAIIHCDLKPANILLDHNFISKVGDLGLSTMLPLDSSSISTIYKDTGPVGTLCYIDPEYQRSGLITPQSDVYAFGMVILQLLTAKPAIAIAHMVEKAIDNFNLIKVLDPDAGEWPTEETKELAVLGVSCAELRRRDRPSLKDHVLPILASLKEVADRARALAPKAQPVPRSHFICPILKDVMDDPCVAEDGYTYERRAIERWFEHNDKSPMTNLPLTKKCLVPNNALRSAIMEWKSGNK